MSESQIMKRYDGDTQLVKNWINFLVEKGWVVRYDDEWHITSKGIEHLVSQYNNKSARPDES